MTKNNGENRMQIDKRIFLFLVLLVLAFLLAGCPSSREPVEVAIKPESYNHDSDHVSKRFQGVSPGAQSAVDSAIELAKRNTQFSEENAALRQKIQELAVENQRLKNSIVVLEPELKQTKKELAEANDLLIEMRIELNNWKTDILGFRNEIRDADKVQLETLRRILEVLGGKIETGTARGQDTNSAAMPLNKESKSE